MMLFSIKESLTLINVMPEEVPPVPPEHSYPPVLLEPPINTGAVDVVTLKSDTFRPVLL